VEIRGGGPQVGGSQVVVADELELALIGLVRAHLAIAGRLADGPARPSALLVYSPGGLQLVDVFIVGLGPRVMPCRALAHALPPLSAVNSADSGYLPGPVAP
jgi:hypothetical protein